MKKRSSSSKPSPSSSIIWNPRATADLDLVLEGMNLEAEARADDFSAQLFKAIDPLRYFPRAGRKAEHYDGLSAGIAELREVLVWDYRIGFSVTVNEIEIVYVAHCRRHFPRTMD